MCVASDADVLVARLLAVRLAIHMTELGRADLKCHLEHKQQEILMSTRERNVAQR